MELVISGLSYPEKGKSKGQYAMIIHPYKDLKPSNSPALQNSFFGFEFKKKEGSKEAMESALAFSLSCLFFFFFLKKPESVFSTVKQPPYQTRTKPES